MEKQQFVDAFIENANTKFNNRYHYNRDSYTGMNKNMTMTCPEHGNFMQSPYSHMRSLVGCPTCGNNQRRKGHSDEKRIIVHNDFIRRAKDLFGDKFDYSKVVYIDTMTKVTIICPKHGEFQQTPNKHLRSKIGCHGCMPELKKKPERVIKEIKPKVKKEKPKKPETEIIKQRSDNFIDNAISKFGDKFDYSKTVYKSYTEDMTIICPKHGEFQQTPLNHLRSIHGCKKCGLDFTASLAVDSKETFINKAMKIHGDTYIYDDVIYVNDETNIKIICRIHGEFQQTPNNHKHGRGCWDCNFTKAATNRRISVDEYLDRFIRLHGDKYDYDLMPDSVSYDTYITVICGRHGPFEITVANHLQHGCQKCANDSKKMTVLEFKEKCTIIHNGKYDYSKVEFNNIGETVTIKCNIHGEYSQRACRHLLGTGCVTCGISKFSPEDFIKRANMLHENKYDYTNMKYDCKTRPVTISCVEHGPFILTPRDHLKGSGCRLCGNCKSKGEMYIALWLRENNIEYIEQKKFADCKNIKLLRFDFYLTQHNKLIEFDGRQHFEPTEFFGGEEKFVIRQKNDEIKNNYALTNNIPLLRIKYDTNIASVNDLLKKFVGM